MSANSSPDTPQSQTTTRPPSLSLKVAEQIASSKYVKSFYITDSANVDSSTISPAETQTSGSNFQRNFSSFNLSGSNLVDNLDFVMGNVKLVDGKTMSEDDLKNGTAVVIISEDVASANNLKVGDIIPLSQATQTQPGESGGMGGGISSPSASDSTTTTATESDYEVIGIYQAVEDGFDVNTIFTSNTVINAMNGTTDSDDTSASIVYLLDSPDHVAAFIAESTPYLTSEYHTLYSDDSEYQSLTKPLNLISFITSILIWVVFIAGAAIILALVTIFVRDRKFEIGLLLSSGEGRLKIIGQFIFEILVIAILAFAVSTLSSNVISKGVSNWIVDNQLLSTTSLIGSTSTSTDIQNGFMQQNSVSVYGSVDMQNVADKFDLSIDATVIGELMLASMLLVFIGSSIPLIVIMGYHPRRILQDDN
jgi:putative ABC transport system permease protein